MMLRLIPGGVTQEREKKFKSKALQWTGMKVPVLHRNGSNWRSSRVCEGSRHRRAVDLVLRR